MGKKSNSEIIEHFNIKDGEIFLRMKHLYKLSNSIYNKNKTLSKTYLALMYDIAMKNTLKIDKSLKKVICNNCMNLLLKDAKTHVTVKNICGKQTLLCKCSNCNSVSKIILDNKENIRNKY